LSLIIIVGGCLEHVVWQHFINIIQVGAVHINIVSAVYLLHADSYLVQLDLMMMCKSLLLVFVLGFFDLNSLAYCRVLPLWNILSVDCWPALRRISMWENPFFFLV